MRWPRLPIVIVGVGVRRQFDVVELEAGVVGRNRVLHVVEDEEVGFRTDEDRVADLGLLQILLGLLGDPARVAVVGLVGHRLENVADDRHRGLGEERIDRHRVGIGHQLHVGLVDRLPAGDGGAVEHQALREGLFVDQADVKGDVLPLAARIGEAEVDVLHVLVLDSLQYVLGGRHTSFPLCHSPKRAWLVCRTAMSAVQAVGYACRPIARCYRTRRGIGRCCGRGAFHFGGRRRRKRDHMAVDNLK